MYNICIYDIVYKFKVINYILINLVCVCVCVCNYNEKFGNVLIFLINF